MEGHPILGALGQAIGVVLAEMAADGAWGRQACFSAGKAAMAGFS